MVDSALLGDPYFLSVIAFIVILALVVYKDRRKVERQGVLLLRKSQLGKRGIVQLGERWPRFWKWFGNVGVAVGFAGSLWILWTLLEVTWKALVLRAAPGFALVLPSLTSETVVLPGVVAPPFWYWIISIGLLVVVHEGMHGVLAAAQRIRIKSLGLGLLAVIPLAFVEPDEKQLTKRPVMEQMRVFAGGSFANFILAAIALGLGALLVASAFAPAGVLVSGTTEGYPAAAANLSGIIVSVAGREVRNVTELGAAMDALAPGSAVVVETVKKPGAAERTRYELTAAEDPKKSGSAFLGVTFNPSAANTKAVRGELGAWKGPIGFVEGLLFFLFFINLGVGAFNLLPIKGLDGGRMWELVFLRLGKGRGRKVLNATTWILILLILVNFALVFKPA